jgi:hypothetical protein
MTIVDVDLEMEKIEGGSAAAADAAHLEPIPAATDVNVKSMTKPSQVSTLAAADLPSIHTDPFATREGKTLTWKNINMTLVCSFKVNVIGTRGFVANCEISTYNLFVIAQPISQAAKGDSAERKLLENVWGEVPKNCTTAVMGPSGAGYVDVMGL